MNNIITILPHNSVNSHEQNMLYRVRHEYIYLYKQPLCYIWYGMNTFIYTLLCIPTHIEYVYVYIEYVYVYIGYVYANLESVYETDQGKENISRCSCYC